MEKLRMPTNGLYAGFSKIDITPEYSLGLSGYSDPETRRATGIEERIYVSCIAVSQESETILIYTIDTCGCAAELAEKMRRAIAAKIEIPGEKIFCAATHCHSAPAFFGHPEVERYTNEYLQAVVTAAEAALADRAPAKLFATKKEFPGMNAVRHFKMSDGTYAGSNFGSFKTAEPIGYATKPDSQMVLVKFEREGAQGDKKDILLVNWQGHPDRGSEIGRTRIAPSYVGPLRDVLHAATGMNVAFFTGADGNTNIDSRIPSHMHNLNWRQYGTKMAVLAAEALENLVPVEESGITTKRVVFEAEIDHSWDHMLPQANEVHDLWKTVGKKEGDALGRTYNFTSVYQSRAIRSRASMGKTTNLELNAFRIGGIGFTTGTYEMFSDAGIFIKENSPFPFTFLLTGNSGYIPSSAAYHYRSYEADTALLAEGTAEKLADRYVEMLKEIR